VNPVGDRGRVIEITGTHEPEEACEVCERRNTGKWWVGASRKSVHEQCTETVEFADRDLRILINKLFPSKDDFGRRNSALVLAVRHVRIACATSLKDYAEQYGLNALKHLFDTVGAAAVGRYHTQSKL
jgi:hypothetical protein